MNAGKCMKMTGCSKATATRDPDGSCKMDAFRRLESGGRNTRYDVWLACV